MSMTPEQARAAIAAALHQIVPDAEVDALPDDRSLREAFELDSLDFLSFVEQLAARAGRRIDEEDYPRLRTMASGIALLSQT